MLKTINQSEINPNHIGVKAFFEIRFLFSCTSIFMSRNSRLRIFFSLGSIHLRCQQFFKICDPYPPPIGNFFITIHRQIWPIFDIPSVLLSFLPDYCCHSFWIIVIPSYKRHSFQIFAISNICHPE